VGCGYEQQGWNFDLMQAISNIPGLEGANDMELAGAIHRIIDLWILGKIIM
jgi:hypothetical protein